MTDDHLRTSDPSILAIGDTTAPRMTCAVAMAMGAYAADVILGKDTGPFRFILTAQCISLGRRDGIVQFNDGRFVSGRAAAWIKELVCRYTTTSIRMERSGFRYRWIKAA